MRGMGLNDIPHGDHHRKRIGFAPGPHPHDFRLGSWLQAARLPAHLAREEPSDCGLPVCVMNAKKRGGVSKVSRRLVGELGHPPCIFPQ